ncbi:TPA: hypothetical protein DIV45_01275 [Patescibacteria group bacterium]|uniref:Uncharacterized protein n=1 Tax=candidate division Kazan bacterium GW2011_GWA1_44_22 TaxID=1620410 RepID=A0A0G1KYT3_UNCK3|nr:MAG: hypothetical protein VE96_C0003G0004 [candidate division Kazan bacterium GW2011_GWA1_44_22]HCR41979.1 hypothetical protein [Patescibacteria group bacterium]
MSKHPAILLAEFIKGELRTILALGLLLVVWVGFGLAAPGDSYTFDFGTGLSTEIAPGAISVNGGAAIYPQSAANGVKFGWQTAFVAEQSSGAQVADLLETDSNQGVTDNGFKISGLADSYYNITLSSGNLTNPITTKVVVGGISYVADSDPGVWRTLTFKTAAANGIIDFNFQRTGVNLWAINAIILTPSVGAPAEATFDLVLLPTEHTVVAGGSALYQIAVVPHNGYASPVILSLGDVPTNLQTSMSPKSGIPSFTARLQVNTLVNTPVTRYTIAINAKGQDVLARSLTKQISLVVANSWSTSSIEPMTDTGAVSVIGGAEFKRQAKKNQAWIDWYLAWERKHVPSTRDLTTLQDLSWQASVEVLPELPEARSVIDASLRGLTGAGIIGMVVDSAPVVAEVSPPPTGFWARFFGSMFIPAQ